jgi:hypothetical protein
MSQDQTMRLTRPRFTVRRFAVCSLLFGLYVLSSRADEPKPTMRAISEAESVLAVYREDWGRASSGETAIILAAWPDGYIVWSEDRLKGGPPYRAGHIDPKRVAALLARFDQDGLFADKKLDDGHFGPDSEFTSVFIKAGKKQVKMCSWHELYEAGGGLVADHHGLSTLDGRRKLDVLHKAPTDYLIFRLAWSETRSTLSDLIPGESKAIEGKPVTKAGKLSWQEPVVSHNR